MLKIGSIAPEFSLPNQDDVEISLRDIVGKWIVLYFYPKDNTPGCTTQACDFTASIPEFDDIDAIVLAVSPDSTLKHRKFIEKHNLNLTLLSDEEKQMCQDYGVWQLKKCMGKEFMGVVRTTFIINPNGEIAEIWNKVSVRKNKKINGETIQTLHVDDVKNRLKELQSNEGNK